MPAQHFEGAALSTWTGGRRWIPSRTQRSAATVPSVASGTGVQAARLLAERALPSQRREAERERRLAPRGRAAKLAEPECPRSQRSAGEQNDSTAVLSKTSHLLMPWAGVMFWRGSSGIILRSRSTFRLSRSRAIDFSRLRPTACRRAELSSV